MKTFFFCVLLIICFGCSYRCQLPEEINGRTVNIPYVRGDTDGLLTGALVYQLAATGLVEYKQAKADYELQVNILNVENYKIGYRKERKPDGKRRKNLIPVEGREKVIVEAYLKSTLTGETLWGPRIISADADYDYVDEDTLKDLSFINKEGQRQSILAFSLGQLESVSCAQEAAFRPLYQRLAKNVVNALIAELDMTKAH
jgi:hypothetical protein